MPSDPSGESISRSCGALILGGFEGTELPPSFARGLREGAKGGAILFRRNVGELTDIVRLTGAIWNCSNESPLIAVDQEGGRVARLGPPFLRVPPALTLGRFDRSPDGAFIARVAECQARELAAVGITVNFAPIFDVHSEEANPIIGDRAFGTSPEAATRGAMAYARGLIQGGVLPCAKHFPGHGDTKTDSHEELPVVDASRERLDRVEFPPFAAAAQADIPFMMTAHVVYPAMDTLPATLSVAISTTLARTILGFRGALLSDDLEMKAVASHYTIEEAAVLAVRAGCDGILICRSEELQDRAHRALTREAESSPAFRLRVQEARDRMTRSRARTSKLRRPSIDDALAAFGSRESVDVARQLSEVGAS